MGKRGFGGPVPDRWLYCPRKSTGLIFDKFLAFKAPLCSAFDRDVPTECSFPPKMIFSWCQMKKIKMGLWIDLTYTSRFYDKKEIESEGCKYVKLQCRGHGETPSREQTVTFISLVHNFIINNPLHCIGIHCTHGFNRTGFMIVSYLVEKMDCSLELALDMFAKARPPGIYKGDYLDELCRRYSEDEDPILPPIMPDWCSDNGTNFQSDNSESLEEPESSSSSSHSGQKSKRGRRNPQFMEGIPGVVHFNEQPKASSLQKKVQVMCGWKSKDFPGCQPVSMNFTNLKKLQEKPYRVSWKADGMRYMMLIDGENEVYFFDRDYNVFRVKGLRFPHRKDLRKHLTNTLLDGEMVIDKVNGEDIPRYLVYDIVKFEKQDVGKMAFHPVRVGCIQNEIINPRYQAMEHGLINKATEPFSVRKKEFWEITQAGSLLGEKFAKTLSHEPDGLIFQPAKEPYIAGSCEDVLKWKPLDMNSIDFRMKIVVQKGQGIVSEKICQLFVGQLDRPFACMKYTKALKELDNKIVECKFEDNQWKFMRERTDKSFPNSYRTANAVSESIKHPVTKENLLYFIEHCRYDNDSVMMPPPAKKVRR